MDCTTKPQMAKILPLPIKVETAQRQPNFRRDFMS
jgi:hypothetical protein